MNIYSIKNEKIGFFNRPIYCENQQEALTYIQNILMSDADRALLGLKDDLSLYRIGEIDFTTGIIYSEVNDLGEDEPCFICSLAEIFDSIPKDRIPNVNLIDELHADMINQKEAFADLLHKFEQSTKLLDRISSCSVIAKQLRYKT